MPNISKVIFEQKNQKKMNEKEDKMIISPEKKQFNRDVFLFIIAFPSLNCQFFSNVFIDIIKVNLYNVCKDQSS